MKLCIVLITLFSSVVLIATPKDQIATSGLSLDPRTWTVEYSSGVSLRSPWQFDLPVGSGHVNYIVTNNVTPMTLAQSVTMTVQIVTTGLPQFLYGLGVNGNNCVVPASVRTHFVGRFMGRKQFTENELPSYYRWWSNPISIELMPGTFTVTTHLTPDQWTDGSGNLGTDMLNLYGYDFFNYSLANPREIGMTFGGGCFFGHGVSVTGGTARFFLKAFAVQ